MKTDKKVALLGGGSWGTTVASVASRNADVTMWARDPETVREINCDHSNHRYLPDISLPNRLKACETIEETIDGCDVLIMGIPSHSFREVLEQVKPIIKPSVPVISLTKGLERKTDFRMTEVLDELLPENPNGVLTGPNLAREIMAGKAAATVIAMKDLTQAESLQPVFHSGLFRVYTNDDVIGCELGGILKNIIAIAVGMGIGLGAGDNTRAALITRGLAEISRLGVAMGGRTETFAGLTGMGDLIATCVSPLSRNHQVGVQLGEGRSIEEIIANMSMVAEGVKSAPTVIKLAEKYNINMPIAQDVSQVVAGSKNAQQAFRGLLRAEVGSEFDPG